VQGTAAAGTWAYFAIPYATPPVGDLRWQAPQPPACWTTPIAATTFGNVCVQLDAATPTVDGDEDCLTMNVWAPSDADASSALPVLFFIHGGGNVQGSSAEQHGGAYTYDGAALAAQTHSVVVTSNYRLGPLGWLAHASFTDARGSSGNYGTLDQIAALSFVHRNIAAFGGDPAHVLLFGESAGAVNVCAVLTSPLSSGLYAAALMESGGCTAIATATTRAFADTFAQKAGCASGDIAACLRGLDAKTLELVQPETAGIVGPQGDFQPSVDGVVLTDTPMNVLLAGHHNHVPLVVGANEDETGQAVVQQYPAGMTELQYKAAVLAMAGGDAQLGASILAQYPVADYGGDPRAAYIAVTSDSKFICTSRWVARSAATAQAEPVRRYFYRHHLDGTPVGAAAKAAGAWHGQELGPLFRHLMVSGYTPSAGEGTLSDGMDSYWSRFAASGDPNGDGAVAWPVYDANDSLLQLDDVMSTAPGVRTAQCDFWDQTLGR
jgi:para-nitrobenzyl esterase